MKTNSLFWALSWVAVGSFAAMQGCGGDDDDDGDDGSTGGKGGSAGSGTGGRGGSAGSATGGRGGSAGSATGGTSGAAGAPGGAGGEGGDNVGGEGGSGDALERATVCAEYCTLYYSKICQDAPSNTYDDMADCQTSCESASYPLGTRGAAAGDSLHCRLTHAALATNNSPPDNVHCGHASEVPTDICE